MIIVLHSGEVVWTWSFIQINRTEPFSFYKHYKTAQLKLLFKLVLCSNFHMFKKLPCWATVSWCWHWSDKPFGSLSDITGLVSTACPLFLCMQRNWKSKKQPIDLLASVFPFRILSFRKWKYFCMANIALLTAPDTQQQNPKANNTFIQCHMFSFATNCGPHWQLKVHKLQSLTVASITNTDHLPSACSA